VSSDQSIQEAAPGAEEASAPARRGLSRWWLAIPALLVLDILAFIVVPPFPPGQPGQPCDFPACYIQGTLEFPAPTTVIGNAPPPGDILTFTVGISNTLLTMWIIGGLLLIVAIALGRLRSEIPGRVQNASEYVYETLTGFGRSLGGRQSVPYLPIFMAFFLLILACNWAGLVPPIGRVEYLRAPTSDVNVTIGLALVSFCMFEGEGFRKLGVRGYLGKFFPFYEFRNGVSAGLIAMFVGLIELMLEFVKPLTLSMRLFGNIYGGEVAIAVITSLTLVFVPVLIIGLEFMLNVIQALIFSVLTLMFILTAIESHHGEEGEVAEDVLGHTERSHPGAAPA